MLNVLSVVFLLLIGGFTVVSDALFSPNSPVLNTELATNHQGLRMLNDVPFSGEMITRYPSGKMAALEEFKDGRRHGVVQKWFESGQLAFLSHYTSGVRDGVTKSWWFNGNQRSTAFFVNGKAEGEAWQWYRNGNKFKRFNYLAGQPSGLQQAWRKNGKLFSNFEYKNGRIFGLRKSNNCVGLEDEKISVDYYRNQAGDA